MALLRIKSTTIDYDWKIAALQPDYFTEVINQNRLIVREFFHEKGHLSPSEREDAKQLENIGQKPSGTDAPVLKKMFLDTIDSQMRVKAERPGTRQATASDHSRTKTQKSGGSKLQGGPPPPKTGLPVAKVKSRELPSDSENDSDHESSEEELKASIAEQDFREPEKWERPSVKDRHKQPKIEYESSSSSTE